MTTSFPPPADNASSCVQQCLDDYNGLVEIASRILTFICLPVDFMALLTNCLNIAALRKIGLNESVNMSFFALSISDLGYAVPILVTHCSVLTSVAVSDWPIKVYDIIYVTSVCSSMMLDISVTIKTYVAIQRGCCVLFPFQVRRLFTKTTTQSVLAAIYIFFMACYLPCYGFISIQPAIDPGTNSTSLTLMYKAGLNNLDKFQTLFNRTTLIFIWQILNIVSLLIILRGLTNSPIPWPRQKSRKQLITYPKVANTHVESLKTFRKNEFLTEDQLRRRKVKDTRVQIQVTMLCSLFLVCHFPSFVGCCLQLSSSDFNYGGSHWAISWLLFSFIYAAALLNAASNFFIYFTFNRKFASTVTSMFKPSRSA